MRWMIGLDLGVGGRGTLALAHWLQRASRPPATQQFVAVHVLDARLHPMLGAVRLDDVRARARQDLDAVVAATGLADAVSERHVISAESVEGGLTEALTGHPCDALVLDRIAEIGERRLVRLGRVARRSLRSLPAPVVVAPPDFTSETAGRGPLVLATDLGESSNAAAVFAGRLATELGRELVVVHVDAGFHVLPTFWGEPMVIPAQPTRIPTDVDDWARRAGLTAFRTRLGEGNTVENVLDVAKLEDAALIVCGSRGLGTLERIFTSSTASDLARFAERPVAVVPAG